MGMFTFTFNRLTLNNLISGSPGNVSSLALATHGPWHEMRRPCSVPLARQPRVGGAAVGAPAPAAAVVWTARAVARCHGAGEARTWRQPQLARRGLEISEPHWPTAHGYVSHPSVSIKLHQLTRPCTIPTQKSPKAHRLEVVDFPSGDAGRLSPARIRAVVSACAVSNACRRRRSRRGDG